MCALGTFPPPIVVLFIVNPLESNVMTLISDLLCALLWNCFLMMIVLDIHRASELLTKVCLQALRCKVPEASEPRMEAAAAAHGGGIGCDARLTYNCTGHLCSFVI